MSKIYTFTYKSPIGDLKLLSDGETLINNSYADIRKYMWKFFDGVNEIEIPVFTRTIEWLDCYFHGENPNFLPPIRLIGPSFYLDVWHILQEIPYGQVVTYKDVAKEVARRRGMEKMSAQAVGGALSQNRINIIVPCHRVVGSNGSLTGYSGGIDRKFKLLELEHVNMNGLFIPKKDTAL